MKSIFFDTETTGLAPGQIAQLSMIIMDETGKIRAKNYFFTVKFISNGAHSVNLRDKEYYAEMSQGKTFADYKDEIYEELKDAYLVAHNIKFDQNFLEIEFWRQGMTFVPAKALDTMDYFREIVKLQGGRKAPGSEFKNPKLIELVNEFHVNLDKVKAYSEQLFNYTEDIDFHDARFDTTAMFVVCNIFNESAYGKTAWKEAFCS